RTLIADSIAAFLVGLNTEEGKALTRLRNEHSQALGIVPAVCSIIRLSECDDIELSSCVTPGSVVIPVALAHGGKAAGELIERAVNRGYEAGLTVGRAIGGARALPKTWPTLLTAPIMSAVTVALLRGFDEDR